MSLDAAVRGKAVEGRPRGARAVLGIDAAWAPGNASGVALVCGAPGQEWRCLRSASSFAEFLAPEGARPRPGDTGTALTALLRAAQELAGIPVDVVAADIPLADSPAAGCRAAERAVSRSFGRRGCPAYPPGAALEEGGVGRRFMQTLGGEGFRLATARPPFPARQALLEVYPHAALLSLLRSPCRVRYKVGHSLKYWPGAPVSERVARLLEAMGSIAAGLRGVLADVDLHLPLAAGSLAALKPLEDRLDALVCAWVGVLYLEGRAVPLGDAGSAVWCPADVADDPGGPPCR